MKIRLDPFFALDIGTMCAVGLNEIFAAAGGAKRCDATPRVPLHVCQAQALESRAGPAYRPR